MSAIIGDIMYLNQALQQPDKEEFIKAMIWEIDTHEMRKYWKIIPITHEQEVMQFLHDFLKWFQGTAAALFSSSFFNISPIYHDLTQDS